MDENNVYIPDLDINTLSSASTTKSLHMIFVVDTSGSMRSKDGGGGIDRMTAVNRAFSSMVPALQNIQTNVGDSFTIYISIMVFDRTAQWHVEPTPIMRYFHRDIVASEYITYYSVAYKELNRVLSRNVFMNQKGKMAEPYIMLMTDGAPTEGDDYGPELEDLKRYNGWFTGAQRYAVLIGKEAVNDPMARRKVASFVTNEKEGIIDAADAQAIVENVSAKTLRILDQMTHRNTPGNDPGGIGSETGGGAPSNGGPPDPFGGDGTGGGSNPWGGLEGIGGIFPGDLVF